MKYIRTKDDGIMKIDFEIDDELPATIGVHTDDCYEGEYKGVEIVKQADTIEELMTMGDLVRTKRGDMYELINQALIYYYARHKSISELFIKDRKGNYIKVAKENEKGELCLL